MRTGHSWHTHDMSKRLQVILADEEFDELQRLARAQGTTVSEWVRRALKRSGDVEPAGEVDTKLAVLRAAARHEFPTADVDVMLTQIERGYLS